MRSKTTSAALAALGLLMLTSASAQATTVGGTCTTTGSFAFAPKVGPLQLGAVKSTFRGTGRCDGTVDGHPTPPDGVPADMAFDTLGYGGCGTAAYYAKAPMTITLHPPGQAPKVIHTTLNGLGYTGVIVLAGTAGGTKSGFAVIDGLVGGGLEGPLACLQYKLSSVSLTLRMTIPGTLKS